LPQQQDRLKKLAEKIDALVAKDNEVVQQEREVGEMRRHGAVELHGACSAFVAELNGRISEAAVTLDPADFGAENFQESGPNLFQINVRGRILQIEFGGTSQLISTEEYRTPYILQGSIRAFNQRLLDQDLIEEKLLFYCLEKSGRVWRFFDARTYRTGPFDTDFLISLMEQLV
jgi:hypothetical protein